MPAKTQGRVALGVPEGRAPWGAQRKGYRQRHRGKEPPRGSQITEGKVPGHRERDASGAQKEGVPRGGAQRRRAVVSRAPPAGSVPHPSSAPVKATLFCGSRKTRNLIKAIQKKEVRNGSRERFVVPQQGWILPRLGSRLHMRSCKRLCPFFPPT